MESWLKKAALEVQEYVRLVRAAVIGVFTAPRYWHDIVEQFDVIGVGSLTVVLLTGFFTGAALAPVARIPALDRRACRRAFNARFAAARMARDYVDVYRRLVESSPAPSRARTRPSRAATIPLASLVPAAAFNGMLP